MLVNAAAVLEHAVVADAGAQQGVPGAVLQQQVISLDVNDAWHVLVPATSVRQRWRGGSDTLC